MKIENESNSKKKNKLEIELSKLKDKLAILNSKISKNIESKLGA